MTIEKPGEGFSVTVVHLEVKIRIFRAFWISHRIDGKGIPCGS